MRKVVPPSTVEKVSVFGVMLVRIFPHSGWIQAVLKNFVIFVGIFCEYCRNRQQPSLWTTHKLCEKEFMSLQKQFKSMSRQSLLLLEGLTYDNISIIKFLWLQFIQVYWLKQLVTNFSVNRSSHREVCCKKGVLKDFGKFTGKNLCQSLFFNKVAGLRPEIRL